MRVALKNGLCIQEQFKMQPKMMKPKKLSCILFLILSICDHVLCGNERKADIPIGKFLFIIINHLKLSSQPGLITTLLFNTCGNLFVSTCHSAVCDTNTIRHVKYMDAM